MKITIKGEEIELKHSFRSFIIYEQIKGEAFAPKTVSDIIIYFYSVVLASKIGLQLTFDEFLTILDEQGPDVMNDFSNWMLETDEVSKQFKNDDDKEQKKDSEEITFTDLMALVCIEYKVCSIDYFMDKMQYYEITPILKNLNKAVRNNWETTRLVMLSNMQPWSKKNLKPSDIMSLPWDKEENAKQHHTMTAEEFKQQLARANAMKEQLQKQGII